ncbi:peptidase S8 [Patiriisocius marinistellae]|uniref:Peptidase S8 n=1 Tax=Patiriisocius marinistellae TaxID=2494560 RepID=A0A5J4FXB7_9FLAO|nr:S8 family serine peptidase [Patiriisocius marinistellae]GEQ86693.1 peptidase S8 [Patiriisocius marinistellae]
MKKLLLVTILFAFQMAIAQEDALVFFNEKADVAASLANPISILTQDALDRKQLHNTPIDERDVPVDENLIDVVEAQPGITVYAKSKWMNSIYVRGSESQIEALLDLPFVAAIEYMDKSLNFSPGGNGTTPDKFAIENPLNRINYDYGAALNQTEMISVDFLHQQDFTGEGMVVAVLDSGFPGVFSNPAFADAIDEDRIIDTYDFVTRQVNADGSGSHGSRTFSDIAGLIDGDFVGTAPGASYYLYVTEEGGAENPVEEAYWVEALERADSLGVDVVNTSLGYQDFDNSSYDHDYEDLDGQTTISARGASHALDKGMLLVTSAGNDGNSFGFVATPADSPGVFTVGAVDSNENYASFSSYGPTFDGRIKPDVMAQGEGSAVIDQNGNIDFNNGTSFSSPIMAGAITSLWQSRPQATNLQIMQIVREASHLFSSPTDLMGYGIPNFEEAYNALQILGIEDQLLASQFVMYPNPADNIVSFSIPSFVSQAVVEIYTLAGQRVMTSEISATNNSVTIDNLASGMYVATVISEDISNTFKLIKK